LFDASRNCAVLEAGGMIETATATDGHEQGRADGHAGDTDVTATSHRALGDDLARRRQQRTAERGL
jgi:hypothetical protein